MGPGYPETGLQLVRPWQEGVQYHLDVGTKQDVILMASRSDVPGDEESETITQTGLEVEIQYGRLVSMPCLSPMIGGRRR